VKTDARDLSYILHLKGVPWNEFVVSYSLLKSMSDMCITPPPTLDPYTDWLRGSTNMPITSFDVVDIGLSEYAI
jgi:hypothetical protein